MGRAETPIVRGKKMFRFLSQQDLDKLIKQISFFKVAALLL